MGYYIDLKTISIDNFKNILTSMELIPSWKVLEENIDKNLEIIKKQNIDDLDELLIALKDKTKIQEMSKNTGLSENYLSVLKRVVNGYQQKPNRIKDFVCLEENTIHKLEEIGIKNTFKLYEEIKTVNKRKELAENTGISYNESMKLTSLTDLSRIRWVNHTFAYVLLECGFDSTEKIANTDYLKLYEIVKNLNAERKIYNASIGQRDMKMVIESAQLLDFEVKY